MDHPRQKKTKTKGVATSNATTPKGRGARNEPDVVDLTGCDDEDFAGDSPSSSSKPSRQIMQPISKPRDSDALKMLKKKNRDLEAKVTEKDANIDVKDAIIDALNQKLKDRDATYHSQLKELEARVSQLETATKSRDLPLAQLQVKVTKLEDGMAEDHRARNSVRSDLAEFERNNIKFMHQNGQGPDGKVENMDDNRQRVIERLASAIDKGFKIVDADK